MPDLTKDQLIKKIAVDVVTRVAPEELPTFTGTAEAYFANPKHVPGTQKHKEDTLGFGLDTAIVYLTPYILVATTEVVEFIVEQVKGSVKEAAAKRVSAFIRNIFKRCRSSNGKETITVSALSLDQRAQLRQRVIEKARQLGLAEAKAELLADAVVGSLITIVDS